MEDYKLFKLRQKLAIALSAEEIDDKAVEIAEKNLGGYLIEKKNFGDGK